MRLLRGLHNVPENFGGCAATIGTFDGLHLGHQGILTALKQVAKERSVPTLVLLFEPQPKEFFAPQAAPARLANFREKLQDLAAFGVDYVLCLPFNQALRSMSADAFIREVLIDSLHVKHLIVGDDFRFGCDRRGDYNALATAGLEYGFSVQDTPTLEMFGRRVSSTHVREQLSAANFERAERLLGRRYRMSGRVAYGRQLGGSVLDTPTANVMVDRLKLPLTGVFCVTVIDEQSQQRFNGVANCGVKPTISGTPEPSLEVHLFEFKGNLYRRHLTVEFEHKIRDEQKFAGLDELKTAIEADKKAAIEFFKNR